MFIYRVKLTSLGTAFSPFSGLRPNVHFQVYIWATSLTRLPCLCSPCTPRPRVTWHCTLAFLQVERGLSHGHPHAALGSGDPCVSLSPPPLNVGSIKWRRGRYLISLLLSSESSAGSCTAVGVEYIVATLHQILCFKGLLLYSEHAQMLVNKPHIWLTF